MSVSRRVARWILKEEPRHYAWADLVRDGRTDWNGVHNPLALRNLKSMSVGERAIFYHTGTERALVGLVKVLAEPRPDPTDPRGSWSVEVAPVRALRRPIPLTEVKADPALAGSDLVRLPRLSVVRVPDDAWDRLLAHEDTAARPPPLTGARRGRSTAPAPPKRATAAPRRR